MDVRKYKNPEAAFDYHVYSINLPRGVVCRELDSHKTELEEFIEDWELCGLAVPRSNRYGYRQ